MMSLTFGLFTQVSGSGPLGPLVYLLQFIMHGWPFISLFLCNTDRLYWFSNAFAYFRLKRMSLIDSRGTVYHDNPVFQAFFLLLFSSPEPKAQGELLPSASVRRVSCVVNNCFKRHLL